MPAGQGKDAELFAAAVELGIPPGHRSDGELARDLEIVAMLRSSGEAFAPRPEEKARAKQRLMALLAEQPEQRGGPVRETTAPLAHLPLPGPRQDDSAAATARLQAVSDAPDDAGATATLDAVPARAGSGAAGPGRRAGRHELPTGMSSRPVSRPRAVRRATSRALRRRALVGAAALVAMIATASAGLLASRDALPGDNLYALKRVAESTGFALAFDDESRARRHLDVATVRMDEVAQMVLRAPEEPADAELIIAALREFDAATTEGARMMLTAEPPAGSAALQDLRTWADDQSERLAALRPALPARSVPEADAALRLLDRIEERTEALERGPSCRQGAASTDDLGPIPARGRCTPPPAAPPSTEPVGTVTGEATPSRAAPEPTTAPRGTDGGGTAGEGPGALREQRAPEPPPERAPDGRPRDTSDGEEPRAPATTTAPRSAERDEPSGLLPPVEVPPVVPGLPGLSVG